MEGTIEDQEPREKVLSQSWKLLIVRGALLSLIGTVLLIFPGVGLSFTAISFALFMGIDGVTQMVLGFRMSGSGTLWWGTVLRGVLEIILSAIIISHPRGFGEFGASALIIVIAIVFIITAVIDLQFRPSKGGHMSPILKLIIGITLILAPLFAISLLFRILGALSLSLGLTQLLLVYRYKKSIIRK